MNACMTCGRCIREKQNRPKEMLGPGNSCLPAPWYCMHCGRPTELHGETSPPCHHVKLPINSIKTRRMGWKDEDPLPDLSPIGPDALPLWEILHGRGIRSGGLPEFTEKRDYVPPSERIAPIGG